MLLWIPSLTSSVQKSFDFLYLSYKLDSSCQPCSWPMGHQVSLVTKTFRNTDFIADFSNFPFLICGTYSYACGCHSCQHVFLSLCYVSRTVVVIRKFTYSMLLSTLYSRVRKKPLIHNLLHSQHIKGNPKKCNTALKEMRLEM